MVLFETVSVLDANSTLDAYSGNVLRTSLSHTTVYSVSAYAVGALGTMENAIEKFEKVMESYREILNPKNFE